MLRVSPTLLLAPLFLVIYAAAHNLRTEPMPPASPAVAGLAPPAAQSAEAGDVPDVHVFVKGIVADELAAEIPPTQVAELDAMRLRPGMSSETTMCLARGYCKITETVTCDEGLVKQICEDTNHLFSGPEACSCVCDPGAKAACPSELNPPSPRHMWTEADCSCQCIDNGDDYCKNMHPAKSMSAAPDCHCLCPAEERERCNAKPSAKFRWSDDDCTCHCMLTPESCTGGQVFYEDRCTCTCLDADRDSCNANGKVWDETGCSCMCPEDKGKDQCIAKAVEASTQGVVAKNSEGRSLGWSWNDETCMCDCNADEAACRAAAEVSAATNAPDTLQPIWVPSPPPECRCQCTPGTADECHKKRRVAGDGSMFLWSPFPSCTCSCPAGTQSVCEDRATAARNSYAEGNRGFDKTEYAGHIEFVAEKCACGCNQAEKNKCADRQNALQASKELHGQFKGHWHWIEGGSCSCSCSLDNTQVDKCTARNSHWVREPNLCQCKCGPGHDMKSCQTKIKLQQEKTMAHLKPAWLATHTVAFVEDQCACKCPVNKALCASEHKALFDEASCSCQCDVAARQRCDADAGNFEPGMMVWKEQGCRCECKLTAKMCRDRPVAPGGDVKVLDTTPRACGCKCPDGLGSQKALCDMKMALPQSGGMFRWNEDTCQCECARKPEGGKHGVCGKEQCTPGQIKKMELSTCKVWDEDTCGCVDIKDAVCPTNVHRGCDWLFRILKNGKDKLAATFQAGTDDIVRYPAHAVCDVLIDSSMSSKGFREHAPPWLLAQIGSNLPKTEDNKDRNLGTHCRSACANRFNLLHSNKGMFQVLKGNIAMKDVSMNEKSCHVWTWKDLQCTGPAPLSDPSGDPTCQTSKFRERMEALFHPDPYAPKPSETEKAWVAHVRSRELRQSAEHKRCGRSQCETMEPPTGLFVLAMDVAWPEQDAEARKIKADRNNDRSGMGTPTTGTRKKKKTGKL